MTFRIDGVVLPEREMVSPWPQLFFLLLPAIGFTPALLLSLTARPGSPAKPEGESSLLLWQGVVITTPDLWDWKPKPSNRDRWLQPALGGSRSTFPDETEGCCMEWLFKEPSRRKVTQSTPPTSECHLRASALQTTMFRPNIFTGAAGARQFTSTALTSKRGTG